MRLFRRGHRDQAAEQVRDDLELYPHEYIGRESNFGLKRGPCVIERSWASGYIIRDVAGRRWTVAKKEVRKR
jgi:hypothetical protein